MQIKELNIQCDTREGHYYVSAIEGGKYVLLAGPFVDDHRRALDLVGRVRSIAEKKYYCNPFDTRFGTARTEKTYDKPGLLNADLGL